MSIIHQREKTHGDYERQARLSQDLKTRIRQEAHTLTHQQLESIEMICVKIARIVCGNPNEADHWLDVQGYAELIHKNLQADSGKSPQQETPDDEDLVRRCGCTASYSIKWDRCPRS
jgi:hypothetical protein